MRDVDVRELKEHTSDILRLVEEHNETVILTRSGKVIARIVPVTARDTEEQAAAVWAEMDELAKEIGAKWPKEVSAVEAVREQRREL